MDDLIKRIVELELRFEQDTKLLKGCRERIDALEKEVKAHEYNDLKLQEAQVEIFRLRTELGR